MNVFWTIKSLYKLGIYIEKTVSHFGLEGMWKFSFGTHLRRGTIIADSK